jgi:hypothetical protein
MFVEPVLKQMTLQRLAVDVLGVVGVLVCHLLFSFLSKIRSTQASKTSLFIILTK